MGFELFERGDYHVGGLLVCGVLQSVTFGLSC